MPDIKKENESTTPHICANCACQGYNIFSQMICAPVEKTIDLVTGVSRREPRGPCSMIRGEEDHCEFYVPDEKETTDA